MKEILLFITGVALFLFGILKLGTGMQTVFSSRIRQYIRFSVKRPTYGLAIGLLSTIIVQSSSATTLLTIGLVSAGLIGFFTPSAFRIIAALFREGNLIKRLGLRPSTVNSKPCP